MQLKVRRTRAKRDICPNGQEMEKEEKEHLNLRLFVELNSDLEEETSRSWPLRVADFPATFRGAYVPPSIAAAPLSQHQLSGASRPPARPPRPSTAAPTSPSRPSRR